MRLENSYHHFIWIIFLFIVALNILRLFSCGDVIIVQVLSHPNLVLNITFGSTFSSVKEIYLIKTRRSQCGKLFFAIILTVLLCTAHMNTGRKTGCYLVTVFLSTDKYRNIQTLPRNVYRSVFRNLPNKYVRVIFVQIINGIQLLVSQKKPSITVVWNGSKYAIVYVYTIRFRFAMLLVLYCFLKYMIF